LPEADASISGVAPVDVGAPVFAPPAMSRAMAAASPACAARWSAV
jgi:hypothetical protein